MKFVIVIAAAVASSILVLPTVSQGQSHGASVAALAGTSSSAVELQA